MAVRKFAGDGVCVDGPVQRSRSRRARRTRHSQEASGAYSIAREVARRCTPGKLAGRHVDVPVNAPAVAVARLDEKQCAPSRARCAAESQFRRTAKAARL